MRTVVIAALLAAVAGACTESDRGTTGPSTYTAPLQVQSAQPDGIAKNHRTHLSGDQEVFTPATPDGPTPADSNAQGQAIFTHLCAYPGPRHSLVAGESASEPPTGEPEPPKPAKGPKLRVVK